MSDLKAGSFPAFTSLCLQYERQEELRRMMKERFYGIHRQIQDSDMVLVGLGELMQYDWRALIQDSRYQEIEREIGDREENIWLVPFLQKMILEQTEDVHLRTAYESLQTLLGDSDYFILSLCMDDYIYRYPFRERRVVTPCGGFRKMQCDRNCTHLLTDIPADTYQQILRYYKKEIALEELREPACQVCGEKLRFNQLGVTRYAEEGYLGQWAEYTKWVQRTVNKKLCVIELGAGLAYPSIIRFPFEKMVFYNQKAFLYRIHPSLYQLEKEIGDRGCGIKENPVEFLINGFVK